MTPTPGVPDVLARTRALVMPAMIAAVDRLAANVRPLATYHLGWTDADGHPIEGPHGKGIRPALAILAAEAAWGAGEAGVPGAVALELVHNFSLVHDDIIDGDTERHHRPTVWAVWGVGPAIIAGDALETVAHQVLLEGGLHGPAASAELATATAAMISGQAADIAFEQRAQVSVEECMAMSADKTGALLGASTAVGAILAGADPTTVGSLRDFGANLGLSFQAIDDLLGIWGDPARTGKPAGNDLRQRKKSMPVVSALAAGGPEADELASLVATTTADGQQAPPLEPSQVERAAYLVEACGGRSWAADRAKSHLDAALAALDRVRLSPAPQRELADLAHFVVDRQA